MRQIAHDIGERCERRWFDRIPVGLVCTLEFLVLGLATAVVVLVVIPRSFGIESSCVGPTGVQSTGGDTYIAGFVAIGTLGWIALFLWTLYMSLDEPRGLVLVLPVLWSLGVVLSAVVVAGFLGPEPCPPSPVAAASTAAQLEGVGRSVSRLHAMAAVVVSSYHLVAATGSGARLGSS